MLYDWDLPDSELARQHCTTVHKIRLKRRLYQKPPPQFKGRHKKGIALVQWLESNRHLEGKVTIDEIQKTVEGLIQDQLNFTTVWRACQRLTFKTLTFKKNIKGHCGEIPIDLINWELPTSVIARIWRFHVTNISICRTHKVGIQSRWDGRKTRFANIPPELKIAISLEEKKAQTYFKGERR